MPLASTAASSRITCSKRSTTIAGTPQFKARCWKRGSLRGQAYFEVTASSREVGSEQELTAQDNTGYQFVQTRGLIVLDTPIGLVACMPIGMAQVSSVVITAEVSREIHKGEELAYLHSLVPIS